MKLTHALFSLIWMTLVFAAVNGGGGPFASHVVLTGSTFLAVVLVAFRRLVPAWKASTFSLRFMWLHGVYAIFCALVAASILFGFTPEYGLSEFLLFVNAGIWMFVLSGIDYTPQDMRFFVQGTVGIVATITLAGFILYITHPINRLAGTFLSLSDPRHAAFNTYANLLLVILPAALWYSLQDFAKKSYTYIAVGVMSTLVAALVLTFSRAAYVSLIAVAVWYVVWLFVVNKSAPSEMRARAWTRIASIILLAIVVFVSMQLVRALYFKTTSLSSKILFSADEGGNSAVERLDYWKASFAMIADRPLLGSGVLSFRFLYPEYQYKFGINEDHPHNVFLKIGVENGLIALGFFSVFVLGVLVLGLRFSFRGLKSIDFVVLVGVAAALVHNLIDFNFVVSNFLLCAVGIGIFLSRAGSLQNFEVRGSHAVVVLVFFMSLGAVVFTAHEAYFNRDLKAARGLIADANAVAAQPYLQRANRLFFKRDYYEIYSNYIQERYRTSADKKWLSQELAVLTEASERSPINARYIERLGENIFATSPAWNSSSNLPELTALPTVPTHELVDATGYFCRALKMDPQNTLRTYYFFVSAQLILAQSEKRSLTQREVLSAPTECGGRKLDVLLAEYLEILKNNEHFTIESQNPYFASQLYLLLGMPQEKAVFDQEWWKQTTERTARLQQ